MSFVTVPDKYDPIPGGIGSYVLARSDVTDYSGTAVYWDCMQRKMYSCP